MKLEVIDFGRTPDGKVIKVFTLTNNNGVSAMLIERGAALVSLKAPDKNGRFEDIVLGFDNPEQYFVNEPFFGSTVGRNANRISHGRITIDGVTYELQKNEGENNLHTHTENGFHKRDWEGVDCADIHSVRFILTEEDGYTCFPGKLSMEVKYTLTDDNELIISYHGRSDRNTIINCTNHSYFNLAGHGSGSIMDQYIRINASRYTPVTKGLIPTGELADVEGTPFDLRKAVRIGDHIDDDFEQLKLAGGYDHNFCIDGADHTLREAAFAFDKKSGRTLTVMTDMPGIQFYCGNFIPDLRGKEGVFYKKRSGFALETQYFPDSINKDAFEKPIFGPDREFVSTTVYRMGIME